VSVPTPTVSSRRRTGSRSCRGERTVAAESCRHGAGRCVGCSIDAGAVALQSLAESLHVGPIPVGVDTGGEVGGVGVAEPGRITEFGDIVRSRKRLAFADGGKQTQSVVDRLFGPRERIVSFDRPVLEPERVVR